MTENYLQCGNKKLIYDEACLHIYNTAESSVHIFSQSTDCHQCSLEPLMEILPADHRTEIIQTTYRTIFQFSFNNSFFKNTFVFEQHGHYGINISNSGISELSEILPANSANGPLFTFLWILFGGWILWFIGSYIFTYTQLYIRLFQPRLIVNEAENDLGAISRSGASTPILSDLSREICANRRIQSLDVFRGFAWIMGTSIMLSLNAHLRNSVTKGTLLMKVFLRSLALCAIGIILNSIKNNNTVTLRFPGVLQRLALAYLIVASLETLFISTQNRYDIPRTLKKIQDWLYSWIQWIFMLILVGFYCFGLFCIKVPGCPTGYLGPGGLHKNSSYINCTGGSAGYIDRQIFTFKHLYNSTSLRQVYHTQIPFDPEGLLGILTTALTMFLGAHAGRIVLCYTNPKGRIIRWAFMAVITGVIAGHLCGWSKEGGSMPLNKNLWTVSFALATSSMAFCMKIFLFLFIDCKKWWSGAPFHQVGKNAILIYIGSIITKEAIPWNWTPLDLTTHSHMLWMNVWSTSLWIVIALLLDRWSVYISI
ncbi:heparan-alpha-glucosaminide N-acetyltransferase-like isoform X2 [Rhodnius prolixus]|uniref:heparan-alpha-glucosaminide N-acetyltransferase-like isoform X2 n=1 Tax=Rhodnius prolixus TaxID=13249 RepID=UPI003D18B564